MGGYGSGRSGWLPTIENGLKLDLRALRRQKLFKPDGNHRYTPLTWTNTYTRKEIATVGLTICAGSDDNWLRLNYSVTRSAEEPFEVSDTFQLDNFAQPFGGHRWYIICPTTGSRCQCLYLPRGATHFRSRLGFRCRLQYHSQQQNLPTRLMESGRGIAAKVLGAGPRAWREKYRDWNFPPKPPWMRWKTYNREFARWQSYEDRGLASLVSSILKRES